MTATEAPLVIGLGELLWDIFGDSRRPGGAPANVAFQAGQLGCRGVVASRVGQDPLGQELLAFLTQQGLSTEAVQRDAVHPTGTVTVDASQADHPTYVIHEEVAWDYLTLDTPWRQLIGQASALCFGTLAQRCPVARQTIQEALELVAPECLVVYDVNLRQQWYQRAWIEESLAKSRVVKLNADEVTVLAKLLQTPSAEHLSFAQTIQERYQVEIVCITRGGEGCLLVEADAVVDRAGVTVEVVDAVGAGDAFTAALIHARLHRWPLMAQASFANEVGALVASRPGAMPPLRAEFAQLAARF